MARKKVFFGKRFRLPEVAQLYILWLVLAVLLLPVLYWWGTYQAAPRLPVEQLVVKTEIARSFHESWRYFNQGQKKDVETLYNLFNRKVHLNDWQSSVNRYNATTDSSIKCQSLAYFKSGSSNRLFLYFFPYLEDEFSVSAVPAFYTGLSLLESLNGKKLEHSVFVIFGSFHPRCAPVATFVKRLDAANPVDGAVVFVPSEQQKLAIAGLSGNVSSLNWPQVMGIDSKAPSLLDQISSAAFNFFQGREGELLKKGLPAIAWHYPDGESFMQQPTQAATALLSALLTKEKGPVDLKNGSFWLSGQTAVKRSSLWLVSALAALLLVFHFINRLYFGRQILEGVQALFSVLYFALVPFLTYVYIYFLDHVPFDPTAKLISIVVLVGFLFLVLKRYEETLFAIQVNLISALLLFDLVMIYVAWLNPVLFVFLVPTVIIHARIKESSFPVAVIYLLLGALPPLWLLQTGFSLHPGLDMLNPHVLASQLLPDIEPVLAVSLAFGAWLSLVNRK